MDLSSNAITYIPPEIQVLQHLVTLNLEDNHISDIPPQLGKLVRLKQLGLAGNLFTYLPSALGLLKRLELLTLPTSKLLDPPKECPAEALRSPQLNRAFSMPNSQSDMDDRNLSSSDDHQSSSRLQYYSDSESCNRWLEQKDSRKLDLQRQLLESMKQQDSLVSRAMQSKRQTTDQFIQQEALQQAKEKGLFEKCQLDRQSQLTSWVSAEEEAARLLNTLLASRQQARDDRLIELARERQLLMQVPDSSFVLRRSEILKSMQETLDETERLRQQRLLERDQLQRQAVVDMKAMSCAIQLQIDNRLQSRSKMLSDTSSQVEAQKQAFVQLQASRDLQRNELHKEIALIEQELCRLTMTEQERAKDRAELSLSSGMAARREQLAKLLCQLRRDQDQRQAEIQKLLEDLEKQQYGDQLDYWLIQYQRLLDQKPIEFASSSDHDQDIRRVLQQTDCVELLPFFQRHSVTFNALKWMNENDLKKIGIKDKESRKRIVQFMHIRAADKIKDQKSATIEPSAPPACKLLPQEPSTAMIQPTAPPVDSDEGSTPLPDLMARVEAECCICMAAPCSTIFLDCGHVCCCEQCSGDVKECPLCRGVIVQRIQLCYYENPPVKQ